LGVGKQILDFNVVFLVLYFVTLFKLLGVVTGVVMDAREDRLAAVEQQPAVVVEGDEFKVDHALRGRDQHSVVLDQPDLETLDVFDVQPRRHLLPPAQPRLTVGAHRSLLTLVLLALLQELRILHFEVPLFQIVSEFLVDKLVYVKWSVRIGVND